MGVVMKGGTSGCRQDYAAGLGVSPGQPLVDTAGSGGAPSSVHMPGGPDTYPMPTGASIPESSSDVSDRGATGPQGIDWQQGTTK